MNIFEIHFNRDGYSGVAYMNGNEWESVVLRWKKHHRTDIIEDVILIATHL